MEDKRPPDALFEEMKRVHSDLYSVVQRLRRVQEKMGLHYDELSRWDERDYPLRRAVTQCFGKTAELMDVCTGGITSVMALEMAQKIWDDAAPKPVAIKAPEVTVETSMDHSSHAGESPYRAESYRPRAVEEVDPELGEILDRYGSEEDLDEEDDEEDEFDDEEEDEDDE